MVLQFQIIQQYNLFLDDSVVRINLKIIVILGFDRMLMSFRPESMIGMIGNSYYNWY